MTTPRKDPISRLSVPDIAVAAGMSNRIASVAAIRPNAASDALGPGAPPEPRAAH